MTIENILQKEDLTEKFVLQKLICYFLDLSKEEMRLNISKEITKEQEQKILNSYHEIVDNKKPLEYVLGFVEFFKRKFHVNGNTLIPRPETEYMILAVTEEIDSIRNEEMKKLRDEEIKDGVINNKGAICKLGDTTIGNIDSEFCLLDIGTGCGVLGISVLLQNPGFFKRAIFTDMSEKALIVAQQNYEILIKDHDFPVEFIQSDLLEFLEFGTRHALRGTAIVVANLPYIPEKMFDENVADNVKKREPKMAFVGGDDGLMYYRKMLDQIINMVESMPRNGGGQKSIKFLKSKTERKGPDDLMTLGHWTMFLEMMTRQVDILRQEYQEYFVFEEVKTFHFNIRIVKTTLK